MKWKGQLFYSLVFVTLFAAFLGSLAVSLWTFRSGDYPTMGLSVALGLALGFLSEQAFRAMARAINNTIVVEIVLDAETIVELNKIKNYYEFSDVGEVIADSIEVSIMALKEQTENDNILCFYNKKNNEIIAIDSMTVDGEIWQSIDGKNERDLEDEDEGEE